MKSINIIPAKGMLLVKPKLEEVKKPSGIYIPDNINKKESSFGTVVAGPEWMTMRQIIFKKWAAEEVELEDGKFIFIKDEDVLGSFDDYATSENDESKNEV